MGKYSKLLLVIFIIIILFLLAFFGTGTSKYESITFDEYKNIKGNNVVYIGDENKVMDSLKAIKLDSKYTLSYLDYSKLTKAEKKKVSSESIEIIKDGKKKDTYKFNAFDLKKKDKKKKLKQVDAEKYVKLAEKEGLHFMFVGSETCGHCLNFKETLKQFFNDYKMNVYYVDLASASEDEYNMIVDSDEYFTSEEWGTPTSIIYYNGKKLNVISGEVDLETLVDEVNNNIGIQVFLIDNKVM